jgi:hypothetical protein
VPSGEIVREFSYLGLQTRDDGIEGHAYRRYWKGHYLPDLSDGAIGALVDRDLADATLPGLSLDPRPRGLGAEPWPRCPPPRWTGP